MLTLVIYIIVIYLPKSRLKSQNEEEQEEPEQIQQVQDFTEEDLVNLRRTLYLTIMSSVDFEECAHKLLKMNIGAGHEDEVTIGSQVANSDASPFSPALF